MKKYLSVIFLEFITILLLVMAFSGKRVSVYVFCIGIAAQIIALVVGYKINHQSKSLAGPSIVSYSGLYLTIALILIAGILIVYMYGFMRFFQNFGGL